MAQCKSKWIKGVPADEPFTEVAQRALARRLPLVWHYLPLAARHYEKDIEFVHQLRVATRRSAAAIQVFRDTLPGRRRKWFDRNLKQIRRAAGKARDLDVLAQRLTEQFPRGYEVVLHEIERHRIAAQEPIVYVYERIAGKRYIERTEEFVDRIRWRGKGSSPKLIKEARHVLRPIVGNFLKRCEADLNDLKALHQLRIAGKRLRYAMELLVSAFDSSLKKDVYPEIARVQQRLGGINDRHVAQAYYQRWANVAENTSLVHALEDLAINEKAEMLTEADAFRHWFGAGHTKKLRKAFSKHGV